jgi:rhodanese-related sulfurtransferase
LARLASELAPSHGRLTPAVLKKLTSGLAERRQLWADLARHDPERRFYLLLHRAPNVDVWLLAWAEQQSTTWHDHGGSSGAFCVAEGTLTEEYRGSQPTLRVRYVPAGQAISFGPTHVHDLSSRSDTATSIHAYSPPLHTMTYYERAPWGLTAAETVQVDGPEPSFGDREGVPSGSRTIYELLGAARAQLKRPGPRQAEADVRAGAVLVDLRPVEQRRVEGEIPGAVIIGRNVLEWRLDPASDARIGELADYESHIIVFCQEGYASSLAAASLRRLGLSRATDLAGGYRAWREAGLPVKEADFSFLG